MSNDDDNNEKKTFQTRKKSVECNYDQYKKNIPSKKKI